MIKKRIISTVFVLLISFLLALNFSLKDSQHFSHLANSFLEGSLHFTEELDSWNDTVFYQGKHYWSLGPFPAIVLVPFVVTFGLIGKFFYQGYLQPAFVFIVFKLCYEIVRKLGYKHKDSLYLSSAFVFSSMFVGVAMFPASWQFSHVVSTLLLFLILYEYLHKKRYWLIGLLLGFTAATRLTASLAITFFILEIALVFKGGVKEKLGCVLKLILPYLVILGMLGIYNHTRFGSFFEQGYAIQRLDNETLERARSYALIGLVHLPGNIYYSLFSIPLPVFKDNLSHVLKAPFIKGDLWGMSIFVTSPYLFYLFFLKYKDKISRIILTTIVVIALPIFLYYGIGLTQFGYRYALDFFPLLFFLLARNYYLKHKRLSRNFKMLIVISALVNQYLFWAMALVNN